MHGTSQRAKDIVFRQKGVTRRLTKNFGTMLSGPVSRKTIADHYKATRKGVAEIRKRKTAGHKVYN